MTGAGFSAPYPVPRDQMLSAISTALEPLRGLRLSIVTRSGPMLLLGFGEPEAYALHVQAPWRLDHLPTGTITGQGDTWTPVPREPLPGWHWRDGPVLLDHRLELLFPLKEGQRRRQNHSDDFRVREIEATEMGDLVIRFERPYVLRVHPDGTRGESWRVFRLGDPSTHFVFEDGLAGHQ